MKNREKNYLLAEWYGHTFLTYSIIIHMKKSIHSNIISDKEFMPISYINHILLYLFINYHFASSEEESIFPSSCSHPTSIPPPFATNATTVSPPCTPKMPIPTPNSTNSSTHPPLPDCTNSSSRSPSCPLPPPLPCSAAMNFTIPPPSPQNNTSKVRPHPFHSSSTFSFSLFPCQGGGCICF